MTTYTPTPEAVGKAYVVVFDALSKEGIGADLVRRRLALSLATVALTAAGPLIAAEALEEAAQWLAATNYPCDWHTDAPVPDTLWEVFVDVVHADEDGRWHGRELTREEVESWMAEEAGRIARGEGS